MTVTPAIHQPCEACGSSDALQINADGTSHCYSCGKTFFPNNKAERLKDDKLVLPEGIYTSTRGISPDTLKVFGTSCYVEDGNVTKHMYPYKDPKTGELLAYKVRCLKDKTFFSKGKMKGAPLFGQHIFSSGGKYLTITEGEVDAMSVYQMFGKHWAVVSIPNGCNSAYQSIKDNFQWVDSFENIILCFDNDAAGIEAVNKVAPLFSPNKVRVMRARAPFKDANDYLQKGKIQNFTEDWWQASKWTPTNVVSGDSLWEVVSTKPNVDSVPYPWDGLNELTYGIRTQELVTLTAGSGMGKTQLMRELIHHLLTNTNHNIGLLMLEESIRDTGLGIMSIEANKPLHLPDTEYTEGELRNAFDNTLGTGRVFMFEHFGSSDIETILGKIKYFSSALDCKYIFLDHISIVVSDQSNGDERRALDEITTKLKTMTSEAGICLFMVSHTRRSSSAKPHEEGGQTSLADLRGTAGIGQLSNIVIGLERNGQADDPIVRNTTIIRVLKNRFSGLTGKACELFYDRKTGRLSETSHELGDQPVYNKKVDEESKIVFDNTTFAADDNTIIDIDDYN